MATGLNPNKSIDPSRWTCFLASINNTAITDKVLHGKTLPRNLEEAIKKAIQLEAGFQLSEGVNMARQINVMQAEVSEVEMPRDPRARSNHCYGCRELGHFYRDCVNPNKCQYRDQMRKKKTLTYNWHIEGQQEFKEEPFEALVAKLTRQKNAYKKKYKQLSKVVTLGKTLITSEGTKIVSILKAQVVKSTGANMTQGTRYTTTKVVPGGKSLTRVKWEDQQVSGMNAHELSENTRSKTRERSTSSTRAFAPRYKRLVVNKIDTLDSNTELEQVHAISDEDSLAPEDSSEPKSEAEQ